MLTIQKLPECLSVCACEKDRDNTHTLTHTRSVDLEIWIKINRENVSHHEKCVWVCEVCAVYTSRAMAAEAATAREHENGEKNSSDFFFVKARNWKPHVLCSKNGLHKKGKQQFALLVAESCYFLCFSFLFTQQCSQFVVAYFLVLTVGTFVHTFCSNLIRLIVCVSPCGLVRFNYVVIVVSANVFVFVCRTWLVEHFEWQIPI